MLKLLEVFYYRVEEVVEVLEAVEFEGVGGAFGRRRFYSSKFSFWAVELCVT